jgi:hypothetical protein
VHAHHDPLQCIVPTYMADQMARSEDPEIRGSGPQDDRYRLRGSYASDYPRRPGQVRSDTFAQRYLRRHARNTVSYTTRKGVSGLSRAGSFARKASLR